MLRFTRPLFDETANEVESFKSKVCAQISPPWEGLGEAGKVRMGPLLKKLDCFLNINQSNKAHHFYVRFV